MSATAMNDLEALDEAIRDMREARDIHEQWARWIRDHPDSAIEPRPTAEVAGDEAHHNDWVGRYDRVLSILAARRGALRSRARRAASSHDSSEAAS